MGTMGGDTSPQLLSRASLPGVAEFERCMMLERQREGIAKAKSDGKYKGRKPLADEIVAKVRAMHNDKRRPTDIAKLLGIGRTSAPCAGTLI